VPPETREFCEALSGRKFFIVYIRLTGYINIYESSSRLEIFSWIKKKFPPQKNWPDLQPGGPEAIFPRFTRITPGMPSKVGVA
jgi:hypothetical protein